MANNMYSSGEQSHGFAFDASVDSRAEFLKKTYLHLFAAVMLYIGMLSTLLQWDGIEGLLSSMSGMGAIIVFGMYIVVSMAAQRMATSATSLGVQYAGLALYVVFFAVMSVPLVYYGQMIEVEQNVRIIAPAGCATVGLFAALSLVVFATRKDFSFLGGALRMAGFIAFAIIVASFLLGFNLGVFFSVLMVGLMSLYVLYDTSNVMHHYRTDQYVSAALALFSTVGIMFLYILRIAISMANSD